MVLTRWPIVTFALAALTLAIGVAAPEPSPQFDLLVLDREQARSWPWLTSHLLHTDHAHLAWNLLALVCIGWLGEAPARLRFVVSLCTGVLAVDMWFALFAEPLRFYCGLSGVLNTVLIVMLYALRGSVPALWLYTFAAAVAIKLVWESATGVALLTHTRWPSAVGAHIAGYSAGMILVGLFAWRDRAGNETAFR
jgi:membrane associated rhomboid family serine protease